MSCLPNSHLARFTAVAATVAALAGGAPLFAAAPVVDRLEAQPASVVPGDLVNLTVEAHDPDCPGTCTTGCGLYVRSDLTAWSATGGTFEATDNGVNGSPYSAAATWRAPAAEATYTLTVSLSDSGTFLCGGRQTTTAQVAVQVTANPGSPPVIDALSANPVRLLPGQSSALSCLASDPDGDPLIYEWTTDLGTVTPAGPGDAVFSAPEPGIATVTCRVTDPGGAPAAATVALAVTGALPRATLETALVAPHRVAVNGFGELFVADRAGGGIAVLSLATAELVQRLPLPGVVSVAVDWRGDLLVGRGDRAEVIDRGGFPVLALAPGPPQGEVADVAVDLMRRRYGVLYRRAGRVVIHDETGAVTAAFGTTGDGPDELKSPGGLAFTPGGDVVVADGGHGLIRIFDPAGTLLASFGGLGGGVGEFVQLDDVEVDAGGLVYASDNFQDWVQVFAPDGSPREVLGTYGDGPGELKTPTGIAAADAFGALVIASANSSRLQVFGVVADPPEAPEPAALASPQLLDFGPRPVGLPSAPRTVTLTNPGAAPLGIREVLVEGDAGSDYTATSGCGELLDPASSCTLQIVFTPTAVGPRPGSLRLAVSASGTDPVVGLAGSGLLPAGLTASPRQLDFPDQLLGTASPPRPVELANPGTVPLALLALGTTGPFQAVHDCPASLPGGASCTAQVSFVPDSVGDGLLTGRLEVATDAPGGPLRVPLEGRGVGLLLDPIPREIDFGEQPVGGLSPLTTVTVVNTGTDFVFIDAVGLAGDDPEQFFLEDDLCSGARLFAGEACTLSLAFTPLRPGGSRARLLVVSNALGSPEAVPLTGTGLPSAEIPTLSPWGLLLLALLLALAGLGALGSRRART